MGSLHTFFLSENIYHIVDPEYSQNTKNRFAQWRVRIRTTTKYRSEQRKSFRETGRTSLSFKTLLVYTLGLRMQYRGDKEECSMKKVCAALFLIILLLAAIVPVSAAGTLR